MDEATKRAIIKNYLGIFYVPVSKKEAESFTSLINPEESSYLLANRTSLLKFACVQLMRGKRLDWSYSTTYDLISKFLDAESYTPFYSFSTHLVILYHLKNSMTNKRLEELSSHTISNLWLENKRVIFLTEINLPQIRSLFVDSGKKVISLNGLPSTSNSDEI